MYSMSEACLFKILFAFQHMLCCFRWVVSFLPLSFSFVETGSPYITLAGLELACVWAWPQAHRALSVSVSWVLREKMPSRVVSRERKLWPQVSSASVGTVISCGCITALHYELFILFKCSMMNILNTQLNLNWRFS